MVDEQSTEPEEALTNDRLSMPARVIYAWMHARPATAVTIQSVAAAMKLHRVSASAHLNSLEESELIERFIPKGMKTLHHWRLPSRA